MADNTQLNVGASGDFMRDIDRGTAKTQVVQLDAGGQKEEALTNAINPLPTTPNGGDLRPIQMLLRQQLMIAQATAPNGFVPQEIPSIGGF